MKRVGYLVGMLAGLATLAGAASVSVPPRLVYNASASLPVGWYRIQPAASWSVGKIVLAWMPATVRDLAAERGYLPRRIPMLKRVAAGPGSHVCVRDRTVWIDGKPNANVPGEDGSGRPLAAWTGCRDLLADEVFLLNAAGTSFDSRYFGPIDASYIVGVAAAQ